MSEGQEQAKSKDRDPKSERSPKSEVRMDGATSLASDFGLRIFFGFRPSDFGFSKPCLSIGIGPFWFVYLLYFMVALFGCPFSATFCALIDKGVVAHHGQRRSVV